MGLLTLLGIFALIGASVVTVRAGETSAGDSPPNVLFVAIDDLNDWVGLLGGHPAAQTPHLDAFADGGSVVFRNAFCPGPACGPSRSAVLTGFMPHTSGLYSNSLSVLMSPIMENHATLPEHFSRSGYRSWSRGKVAHPHSNLEGLDAGQWMFDHWEDVVGRGGVERGTLTSRDRNLVGGAKAEPSEFAGKRGSPFAWGVSAVDTEQTKDFRTAEWAAKELGRKHEEPFFLAVGFAAPHLPFFAPREFWDRFPADGDYLPPICAADLDDIHTESGEAFAEATSDYRWLEEQGLRNEAARAYLASVAFLDHCLGEVFAALEAGPHADDTIVVVWSDHGFHLGEKLRYRKGTLWSETTRVPLVIRTPGMEGRRDCVRPVNLVDLYPTLLELCGMPEKDWLDGRSLAPLLEDPDREWGAAIVIDAPGDVSVRTERWNFIQRKDAGVVELYDLAADPHEWKNLADDPELEAVRTELREFVPARFAPPVEKVRLETRKRAIDESIRPRRLAAELK